jgi:two-component system, NarL family, response regulator
VPGKIRVMIVADHPIMLDGLRMAFAAQKDMEIVCEATDATQSLRDFELCRPDVTIVDLQRPTGEGWRTVRTLRERFPDCAVVVLTTYPGETAAASKSTAVTLEVPKTASGIEIIAAARRAGNTYAGTRPG